MKTASVIPRLWLALVGHYRLQTHNDTWWDKVVAAQVAAEMAEAA
ncbi:MAG: hypothetical protein ACR2J8_01375 [Thermomicrobiales bacterium]